MDKHGDVDMNIIENIIKEKPGQTNWKPRERLFLAAELGCGSNAGRKDKSYRLGQ